MGRRQFGSVRKLPSGRWQARYTDPAGRRQAETFSTKGDANRYLAAAQAEIDAGRWIDRRRGEITLRAYSAEWMAQRKLKPRTVELYEGILRNHILPKLGEVKLNRLTPVMVRRWHTEMRQKAGRDAPVVARSYRMLRAMLNTAVTDELLARNPCKIEGAGVEHSPERPTATMQQVQALADTIDPPYRAMVWLATFTTLRIGEMLGLRRADVDLDAAEIRVREQLQELSSGKLITETPNSGAGVRTIAIPPHIVPELKVHLYRYAGPDPGDYVFRAPQGGPLRRGRFGEHWREVREKVGLGDFHFHDPRHTGNTMAAATGASTKELMARMGHSSPRAALVYQHATRERDRAIANAISHAVGAELTTKPATGCIRTSSARSHSE
jgi:integrase